MVCLLEYMRVKMLLLVSLFTQILMLPVVYVIQT